MVDHLHNLHGSVIANCEYFMFLIICATVVENQSRRTERVTMEYRRSVHALYIIPIPYLSIDVWKSTFEAYQNINYKVYMALSAIYTIFMVL